MQHLVCVFNLLYDTFFCLFRYCPRLLSLPFYNQLFTLVMLALLANIVTYDL